MLAFFLLLIGFILVIKASDLLVDCATSLAIRFKVPKMLIALTIVSFGTCAPEIAISFQSVSSQNGDIAFANVIGSCIVNVFLIVGLAAFLKPIRIQNTTIKKELPLLLTITLGFSILMLDSLFQKDATNTFSRIDGIILILLFGLFVFYLIQMVIRKKEENEVNLPKYKPLLAFVLLILSLLVITYSSDLIVNNAEILARQLHISEKIITMVLIVIGTSLPEMSMTITSARKGEFDMAIGNIIGTNIFNICIVLGLPVALYGSVSLAHFSFMDILFVFLSSFILYLFSKSEKEISKREGLCMILLFVSYYSYILFF